MNGTFVLRALLPGLTRTAVCQCWLVHHWIVREPREAACPRPSPPPLGQPPQPGMKEHDWNTIDALAHLKNATNRLYWAPSRAQRYTKDTMHG